MISAETLTNTHATIPAVGSAITPFIVTSVPINPPWDQGDKNQAYLLTRALPDIHFRVLTCRGEMPPDGENLSTEPLYHSRNPSLREKLRVYRALFSASTRASLIHFIFRPYLLSSLSMRLNPVYRQLPSLQTIPATADGPSLHYRHLFADRVVSISEHGLCVLRNLGRSDALYIPPGVDPDGWRDLGKKSDEAKARLGLGRKPVVLFAGHYGNGQGSETMTRSLPALLARQPDAHVIYACRLRSPGERHAEKAIQARLNAEGLAFAVSFYRQVVDMRALIGAADVVALPLESMRGKIDIPITLLEALAAGKPVVVADIAPMNEILNNPTGGCIQPGLLVPAENAAALAEAIASLLKDAALRRHMGANGEELVRQRYHIANTAASYRKLYEELSL